MASSAEASSTTLFISRGLAAFGNQFVHQRSTRLHVLADQPLSPLNIAFQSGDAQFVVLNLQDDLVEGPEAAGEFAGVQAALAVQPAKKIVRWLFSFLRVAFDAARNQVAVGIAPQLHPRHDVVQALDRRRGPPQTVKALAAL